MVCCGAVEASGESTEEATITIGTDRTDAIAAGNATTTQMPMEQATG